MTTPTEVLQAFGQELTEAVAVTSEKVVDLFDLVPATTEVATAVLSRYQRTHPELFLPTMKVLTINLCMCGRCRTSVVTQMNKPLAMLMKQHLAPFTDDEDEL